MKDWDFICFEEISSIFRRSRVDWTSSISYLIVSNYMNCASYCIVGSF